MWNQIAIVITLAFAGGEPGAPAAPELRIETTFLRATEQVEVSAQASGILDSINVREGDLLTEGALLAVIEQTDARLALEKAKLDLEVAQRHAENQLKAELAKTVVTEARVAREKAILELLAAQKKADNDVQVQYTKKALAIAEAEFQRATRSRKAMRESVSESELDALRLQREKAAQDSDLALHEKDLAQINRQVKQAEIRSFEATSAKRDIEYRLALEEIQVAQLVKKVEMNNVNIAQRNIERRRIRAPLGGVVVQIYRRRGEWVEPGEKILRILRIDRLRVEGFVQEQDLRRDIQNAPVSLSLANQADPAARFPGKIVFVSPEVDPVNGQVAVWAEVENPAPHFPLRPGMHGSLRISAKIR